MRLSVTDILTHSFGRLAALVVVLSFSTLSLAFSQPLAHYDQRVFLGIRGGLNIAKIDGKYDVPEYVSLGHTYKNRLTGHVGLLANYYIGYGLAFQGELNYAMMGSKVENNRQGVAVQAINFLEIPAIARYYFGKRMKKPQFYIETGPVIQIALFANDHYEKGKKIWSKEQYRGASYGVLGGLGLKFYAERYRILVGARYTAGFTDMHEYEKVINKVRAISVGVTIMRDLFYYY